jgi:GNAT superfamily N-acetyltransferase
MIYYQLTAKEAHPNLVRKIAYWHNLTPKLWLEEYKVTDEDVLESYKRMMDKECYIGIAADDEAFGFLWAEASDGGYMILSLYIKEAYRKQNHATKLKDDFEKWCRQKGIEKIITTVHYKNKKMIALNEKLGYSAKFVNMEKKL